MAKTSRMTKTPAKKQKNMRPFIVKSAGASFFSNSTMTSCIRKDYFEYILKLDRGLYFVWNVVPCNDKKVVVVTEWKDFLRRVTEHEDPVKLLKMLEKPCPRIVQLFRHPEPLGYIALPKLEVQGIGRVYENHHFADIFDIMGNPEIKNDIPEMTTAILKAYQEIVLNCPFEGWKKGINEVLWK
jgi:hypothetical protein